MIILGAGMAGCLAGIANPSATILEANPEPPINHKAVLRFRNESVSKATGIPFKEVKVQKAIWFDGKFVSPSPKMSNYYSQKVLGIIASRSIDDISTKCRYVAPSDFQERLIAICGKRIKYGMRVTDITKSEIGIDGDFPIWRDGSPIVSTMPLPILAKVIGKPVPASKLHSDFNFRPIYTTRFVVKDCDVYQTIYFPEPDMDFPVYRATLTGNNLIVESVGKVTTDFIYEYILQAFGIFIGQVDGPVEENYNQKYGKIQEINEFIRRTFIHNATMEFNIYSLGRFATWRNILLDDVIEDINVIRRLETADIYSHLLETQR